MFLIALWVIAYDIVVAASIMLLGKPSTVLGQLTLQSLAMLLLDWRFLLGGVLAVVARFVFVIINNLASKQPSLASAHLSLTAIASVSSIVVVILANHFLLGDQLHGIQLVGTAIVILGLILIFR